MWEAETRGQSELTAGFSLEQIYEINLDTVGCILYVGRSPDCHRSVRDQEGKLNGLTCKGHGLLPGTFPP